MPDVDGPKAIENVTEDIERVFTGCYEKQMQALLAIGLTVASGRSQSTLLFGLPGTGKTSALYSAESILKRKFGKTFGSSIYIEPSFPHGVVRNADTGMPEDFELLRKSIAKRPALICFDEIDVMGRAYPDSSSGLLLPKLFISFLDSIMAENEIWLVGIATSPGSCDPAITQRFRVPIFFDLPDLDTIQTIIDEKLKIDRSRSVARLLFRKMSEFGIYLTLATLLSACRELSMEATLKESSDEDVVSRILAIRGSGISADSVKNYERVNSGFINVSLNEGLPFWSKELKRFEGSNLE